jgi:hypothetical protein
MRKLSTSVLEIKLKFVRIAPEERGDQAQAGGPRAGMLSEACEGRKDL